MNVHILQQWNTWKSHVNNYFEGRNFPHEVIEEYRNVRKKISAEINLKILTNWNGLKLQRYNFIIISTFFYIIQNFQKTNSFSLPPPPSS